MFSENKISKKDLKSISGVSSGSFLSLLLITFDFDFETIANKLIDFDYNDMIIDFTNYAKLFSIITQDGYLGYSFKEKLIDFFF